MAEQDVWIEFNYVLKTFMRSLKETYPHMKEFGIMLGLYKIMKTLNKKTPQRYFQELIAEKYYDDLINKNFDVFLSDNFDDKDLSYLVKPLKIQFKKLNEEEREVIWKHIIVLLACNKNCLNSSKKK